MNEDALALLKRIVLRCESNERNEAPNEPVRIYLMPDEVVVVKEQIRVAESDPRSNSK